MASVVVIGFLLTAKLAKQRGFDNSSWHDVLFYSLIGGFIGARLYHVFLELPYYLSHPLQVLQVWQGGLAIHGGLIGGGLVLYYFSRKNKWSFLKVSDIMVIALILGQALGRWGNYFNQELFGLPTDRAWGIFIDTINRPVAFINFNYFHPTFLYEFMANIVLFVSLLVVYRYRHKVLGLTTFVYLVGYSVIRFCLEFVRIDKTPELWGLRWPQWASIVIIFLVVIYWTYQKDLQNSSKPV